MKKSSTNSNPEVSVVIVNYNTGKLLKECIDSVIKSCPKCEIIVVDNASTDEGITPLRLLASEGLARIRLIQNKNNPGFSKANNQAIRLAKGKCILLLNPDTKVLGDAIQQLVDFAQVHPDAGVVAPQLLNSDNSVQNSVMPFPTIFRAIHEFWFKRKAFSKYVLNSNSPQEVEAVVMAGFLITPKARELVGLLDEKYFMYFEDLDYCKRVHQEGLNVYYVPSAQVIHYHGVSGKNLSDEKNQWRRLVPGSKLYHGVLNHYLINFIIWFGSRILHKYG